MSTPENSYDTGDVESAWRNACKLDLAASFFEGPHYAESRARKLIERDENLDMVAAGTGVRRDVLGREAAYAADRYASDPAHLEGLDRFAPPDWAELRGDKQTDRDQEPLMGIDPQTGRDRTERLLASAVEPDCESQPVPQSESEPESEREPELNAAVDDEEIGS